jgi:diguanylate cyclase (GGDEF)-like protein
MSTRLRLLLVEDSAEDAVLVVDALEQGGFDVVFERTASADGLIDALERQSWDVVVADFTMPGFGGTAALHLVREHRPDLPFIFVSGTIGEDTAVAAMRDGAQDYIVKGNLRRLAPAVERELREVVVRRERTRAEERLAYLAYHDPLTDLPNRRLLFDRLQQAIRFAHRSEQPLAVLVLDLDGFKEVNDAFGHHAGDQLLEQVGQRLRHVMRDTDTVARLGGDEFAIILPTADLEQAERATRKVLREIERPFLVDSRTVGLRASVGIAAYPYQGGSADVLLQNADAAMYVAKTDGCASAVYSLRRDRRAYSRRLLIAEMRDALTARQFAFEYQPIVRLPTNQPFGVETLLRWQHPVRGRLLPESFIGLAEQAGLIDRLTLLALDRSLQEWKAPGGGTSVNVAINVSPLSLQDPDFVSRIAEVVEGSGAKGSDVTLEITENVIVADPPRTLECLRQLHDLGLRLVVDDFGTGYSSLSYLRRLPVDALKIDKSFVLGLADGEDEVIVRSTIDLAHNLGLEVIAEGVENQAVRDRLAGLGCDLAQGLLFGGPESAAATRERLQQTAGTG